MVAPRRLLRTGVDRHHPISPVKVWGWWHGQVVQFSLQRDDSSTIEGAQRRGAGGAKAVTLKSLVCC